MNTFEILRRAYEDAAQTYREQATRMPDEERRKCMLKYARDNKRIANRFAQHAKELAA